MTRKEYIEKLETIRVALLKLGADFKSARMTDENPMEEARRKVADKFFDKLDTFLFENGAVSLRIMDENARDGIGEQCDLFDEARFDSATNEEPAGELDFPTTATKTIGVCKYCADGICVLEPNYGKNCDGLDTECDNHAEKTRKGKKGGK